jgi:chaperonin GroES
MGDFPIDVEPIPLWGHVLVRLIGNSTKSAGGIVIPETVVNRPVQGVVEAVSDGNFIMDGHLVSHKVHIGDTVIFNWKSGFDLVLDDGVASVEYRIIAERDIVAILKGVDYGKQTRC